MAYDYTLVVLRGEKVQYAGEEHALRKETFASHWEGSIPQSRQLQWPQKEIVKPMGVTWHPNLSYENAQKIVTRDGFRAALVSEKTCTSLGTLNRSI